MNAPGKLTYILREADIHDERNLLRTKWENPAQIRRWLLENGFKRLGGGVFSTAYAKPGSKRVVKISLRKDECWLKFAKWALTQTANPYLPKIWFIQEYEGLRRSKSTRKQVPTKFFISIVERLNPAADDHGLHYGVIDNINDPVPLAAIAGYSPHLDPSEEEQLGERLAELGAIREHTSGIRRASQRYVQKNKNHPFVKAMNKIKSMTGSDCWNDLHSGNFMYRPSTNSLVLTDPLAQEWT